MSLSNAERLRIKAGALMVSALVCAGMSAFTLIDGVWPAALLFIIAALILASMSARATVKADEEIDHE